MIKFLLGFLIFLILNASRVSSINTEFSVVVEAGSRECFYQNLKEGLEIYFDYQVIQGGELDITFWLNSPSNRILITDLKKDLGQHKFKTEENGEFRFCFDNSFSRFAQKQVFFYMYSPDHFIDPDFPLSDLELKATQVDPSSELDTTIEYFNQRFTLVQDNLEHAQRLQAQFKMYEHVDRFVMENNYASVNFWSIINICLMIGVGVVQVVMIRSLFEDKSKIGRALRGTKSTFS
jgi:protein ERP2